MPSCQIWVRNLISLHPFVCTGTCIFVQKGKEEGDGGAKCIMMAVFILLRNGIDFLKFLCVLPVVEPVSKLTGPGIIF